MDFLFSDRKTIVQDGPYGGRGKKQVSLIFKRPYLRLLEPKYIILQCNKK